MKGLIYAALYHKANVLWIVRFRMLDMAKKEHRQKLIITFVNTIYLYDDKVVITFNYKEGSKTLTLPT